MAKQTTGLLAAIGLSPGVDIRPRAPGYESTTLSRLDELHDPLDALLRKEAPREHSPVAIATPEARAKLPPDFAAFAARLRVRRGVGPAPGKPRSAA